MTRAAPSTATLKPHVDVLSHSETKSSGRSMCLTLNLRRRLGQVVPRHGRCSTTGRSEPIVPESDGCRISFSGGSSRGAPGKTEAKLLLLAVNSALQIGSAGSLETEAPSKLAGGQAEVEAI